MNCRTTPVDYSTLQRRPKAPSPANRLCPQTSHPDRYNTFDFSARVMLSQTFLYLLALVALAQQHSVSGQNDLVTRLNLSTRELVRRTTSQSPLTTPPSVTSSSSSPSTTTATTTNLNDLHNEINAQASTIANDPHQLLPKLPPNYVKLGNNTSSLARSFHHATSSNLVHLRTASVNHNQTFNSDINNSQQTISQRSKTPEVICIGTSNRLSGQSNKTDQYHNLFERYKNCTHVIGNLEITWLGRGPDGRPLDLSFLDSIREIDGYLLIAYVNAEKIRLPNLHIIRGRETFKLNNPKKDEFSMLLLENEMKFLELPNLREIINGNVGFYNNKNLCLHDKIDWVEILNAPFGTKFVTDGPSKCDDIKCHPSCGLGPCWSPDEGMCQQFSKTVCSPQCDKGRCYGPGPRDCCHMMCAGGCTGPKQTDCFACKNFNNDGECVPECPPMSKYNPSKFLWEPNLDGRHSYGASCVKECPEHLLRDNGACVRSCPPDKRSQNGECVPCAGPCPKNCQGVDVVNSNNIENFVNCTEIEGSITILETSFTGYAEVQSNNKLGTKYEPMHPSKLMVFQTVRKITGYVNIQAWHPEFKNLSFLSKLETIDGRQSTDMFHSLSIVKTSLTSLNLRSLKRIKNGKVVIEENKDLCYADISQFLLNNITKREDITIKNNGDSHKCRAKGLVCHEQCAQGGCWGPGQEECLSCKHYKLDDYCVKDCASTKQLGILSYNEGNRTCNRCHLECKAGCSGTSAKNCWQCKNFKDGPYCVQKCPKHKYNDNDVCQECSKRCVNGCTGSSDRLGQGGCNMCDKFVIESISNSTVIASCLKADEPCPMGYYQEYGAEVEEGHHMKAFERKPVCKRCHQKCKSCSGYGTHKDVCECAGYMANDQCEETCPRDFYADSASRRCLRCSRECNGCYGPTEADCLNCRVYRLYYDSAGPIAAARVADISSNAMGNKQQGRFNCTSQCPAEKPHRISEGNLIDPYCSEDPGPDADNPRIVSLGSTSFFFILIISGAIMFCISVYRCQIERDKTAKLAMALSLGITDAEPLNQSHMPPNLAELRSITTSELKQGPMLGHGVGGTVYQAVWCPEGTKDRRPVAMKILRDNGQQNMNKEFLDEAYIMASVKHHNLVKLLGVCITPKELILVTPLMPLGCLRDYVEKNKHEIGPKNLLEWGKQIANGMAYLEEHRMVHRDLALRNVLLQTSNRALISDFGLAKFLEVDQSEYHSGGGRLPIKWLAPECIRERKFTHKSDVWAFGVTIWELLTFGEKPFDEYDPKDVPMAIEKGARLQQPNYVTAEVYKVMYACWFYNPEDRPNFKSLSQDFVNFARDPERYLSWRPNGMCQNFDCRYSDNEDSNECDSDENSSLNGNNNIINNVNINSSDKNTSPPLSAGPDLMSQHNRMNEMMGIEMRQHSSESDAQFGHVSTPIVKRMSMFSNGSSQPLMAEDVFSRSSQQMSSKSSNTTVTDPNNNLINANNPGGNNNNHSRQATDSWWSVVSHQISNNSLGKFPFVYHYFIAINLFYLSLN
jgi:epidermal growth factor receptor